MRGRRRARAGRGSSVLIPHPQTRQGLRRAHDNAVRHLDDALCLYGSKRFQSAIPSSVLSAEESIKGIFLAAAHRRGSGVSAHEWNRLQNHRYKLRNARKWAEEGLDRGAIVEACTRHIHSTARPLFGARPVPEKDALAHIGNVSRETLGLQTLKKASTYDGWNATHGAWDTFGHLPEGAQDALAVYALHLAVLYHDLVRGADGPLRESCARTCGGLDRAPGSPFSAASGRTVLRAILDVGSVAQYAYQITDDIYRKCRSVALGHGDYDNKHPLVKTMIMSVSVLKEKQDGNYLFMSDDSGQTYGGKATMFAILVVSKEGRARKIEKVCINDVACEVHDSRIGAILETERVIDRLPGQEAPLSAFSEAFSRIGLRVRKLRDEEIDAALENAHRMADGGQLAYWPPDMVDAIRNATREGWDGLDPEVRSAISSLHVAYTTVVASAAHTAPIRHSASSMRVADSTGVVLSGYTDPVRKYKIRQEIWQTLCSQKSLYERGTA